MVVGWVCFAAVSAFDLCVSATSSFFASGYIGVAGVFLGFMRGSTQAALWGVLADVVVVSKLLAFSTVVDRTGGSVLCCFKERGKKVKSFVANSLGCLFAVYGNYHR